jgi:endonuclease III
MRRIMLIMQEIPKMLIDAVGGRFSSQMGIDLSTADPEQIFKWFLASKLFGARISSDIAIRTYKEFEKSKVTSAEAVSRTGWDGLVRILDEGGYVRYDFSTATKLLEIMDDLRKDYNGNLNELHRAATNEEDLEDRLKGLGKGIGDVTVNIFLRELRGVWKKAEPGLPEMVTLAAGHLGLVKRGEDPLRALKKICSTQKAPRKDFRDFEAALLRLGKDYCRKSRHDVCPMRNVCKHRFGKKRAV